MFSGLSKDGTNADVFPCGTSLLITFEGEVSANSSPTLLAYFAPVFFYGTVYCRGFRREAGLPGEPY
jgi:hypothetical protein